MSYQLLASWYPCCHVSLMCMWLFPSLLLLCCCCEPRCTVLWVSLGRLGCCLMMTKMVANISWIETVWRTSTEQEKPEQVSHQLLSVNADLYYHIDIIFSFYLALIRKIWESFWTQAGLLYWSCNDSVWITEHCRNSQKAQLTSQCRVVLLQ